MNRRTIVIVAAAGSLAVAGALTQSLVVHASPAAPAAPAAVTSTAATTVTVAAAVKPLPKTMTFYVDPKSGPATWVAQNRSDSRAATIRSGLSSKPMARWFGSWSSTIKPAVNSYVTAAAKKKKTPVLVAYNIPARDACGGRSAGGTTAASQYRTWIRSFAQGIGQRRAVVVLEPDALADFQCLTATQVTTRQKLLTYATTQLHKSAPKAYVYLDAGNSNYASASDMSARLIKSGLKNVRGFSLNVSNFHTTAQENAFAVKLNAQLRKRGAKTKPYVIDTSRNGAGSDGTWCNPGGRKLGVTSRVNKTPKANQPEARLWIKTPGESDGNCGTASTVAAGVFDPQLAVSLVHGS